MAMTYSQYAMIEDRPLNRGVIDGLLEYSFLLDRIPWSNVDELTAMITRIKTLPTSIGFRDLNAAFSEGTGDWEQIAEGLYDFGTDIDVDSVLVRAKNTIVNPRSAQTKLHLKALAYKFNDLFINADRATDPKGIDGIKVRHADLAAADSELEIDAAGLDISEATGRDDYTTQLFLDYMNRLLYRVEGEPGKKIICTNDRGKLAFLSMFRRSSLMGTTATWNKKNIETFMDTPILDLGWLADQTTRCIALNHDDSTASGTSARTSIYIVSLGEGEAVHGVQLSALDTRDLGELEDKPVYRTRLQWTWGLANWGRRSISRLKGLYAG